MNFNSSISKPGSDRTIVGYSGLRRGDSPEARRGGPTISSRPVSIAT